MVEPEVTIELPAKLHDELQALASEECASPAEVIQRLVSAATRHRSWLRDLTALRELIREEGGLQVGASREEVIARLRQTRREIFETEYAHLYR